MPKLPALTGREVVSKLERLGFRKIRQRGSHVAMKCDEKEAITTVPVHSGKTIKRKTLASILKQSKVTLEEFLEA